MSKEVRLYAEYSSKNKFKNYLSGVGGMKKIVND
jgi:hypothetical protein